MRKTLVTASILTLFLFAGLAPVAVADGDKDERKEAKDEAKEQRKQEKEERKEAKDERKEAKEAAKEAKRGVRGNVSLDLSGTALGKDNLTYTVEVNATGVGVERTKVSDDNETKTRLKARLMAHVVVKDANGTIVKEGNVSVKLYAHGKGDDIRWVLSSVGKKESGIPRVLLHGQGLAADGEYELEGKGRTVFKAGDEKPAMPLKLREVSGSLVFVPFAAAAAA